MGGGGSGLRFPLVTQSGYNVIFYR
jgi:hypothetical protein